MPYHFEGYPGYSYPVIKEYFDMGQYRPLEFGKGLRSLMDSWTSPEDNEPGYPGY
jgi:hypothetical protein